MSAPLAQLGEVARLRLNGLNGGGCPYCKAPMDAHRPWCTRPDLRKCRRCAAPIPFAGLGVRYCQACREAPRCRRCLKPGGLHNPSCRIKAPRQALPYQGTVTVEDIAALYAAQRARLVRFAARWVGSEDAQDVVQQVFAYFLSRVDTLKHMTPSLATTAVKHVAMQEVRSGRARYTKPMDHTGLLLMERLMEAQRRGVVLHEAMRLPEPA